MPSTVGDLMTSRVIAVSEKADFKEIALVLRSNGISAVPVVDPERRVVGVVSAADLLLKIAEPDPEEGHLAEGYEVRIERMKRAAATAWDLMTAPAITIAADATPQETAERMHRHRVKRLPVVAGGGRLVGLVSRADLLGVYAVRDELLQQKILLDTVRAEFGLQEVDVSVREGVVVLDGRTPRRSDIPRLLHTLRRQEGVVRVHCQLDYDVDDLSLMGGQH